MAWFMDIEKVTTVHMNMYPKASLKRYSEFQIVRLQVLLYSFCSVTIVLYFTNDLITPSNVNQICMYFTFI
jgi:hypothetical protein